MSNYIPDSEKTIVVPLSFETGEQTDTRILLPREIKINSINSYVVKALAGVDAGTITVKDGSGNTISTLTYPLSSAINVNIVGTISTTFFKSTTFIELIAAKTTPGGKVLLQIDYVIVDSGSAS